MDLISFSSILIGTVFTLCAVFLIPSDLKAKSTRPIFLLIVAMIAWFATPSLLFIPTSTSISYPPENVISGNTVIQYPAYTTNTIENYPLSNTEVSGVTAFCYTITTACLAILLLFLYDYGGGSVQGVIKALQGKSR